MSSHFPWKGDGKNYIRGDTIITGHVNLAGDLNARDLTCNGGISELNPQKYHSHFPWKGDGKNYIRGDTIVTGHISFAGNLQVNGDVKIKGKLCLGHTCITSEQFSKLINHQYY
jgi:hypothetical protein